MSTPPAYLLVRAVFCGIALFGLVAHALLLAGQQVAGSWLAGCLLVALGAAARRRLRAGAAGATNEEGAARAPRWLLVAAWLVPACCAVALAYGAVATPDRAWDGVVAWGLKAAALTAAPSLDQPFFADPAVLHHSPDYPLLQPLCLAALGQLVGAQPARLLFPLLYLLFVALAVVGVRRSTADGVAACAAALAVGTTPFFLNPSGGGADSGYAEMFLALVVTAAAVGLLLGDGLLLGAAATALPWIKPEGTIALLGLLAVCFVAARARAWLCALGGGAVGLMLWLPLQWQLGHYERPGPELALAVLGTAALAAGVRAALDRYGCGRRGRAWTVAAGLAVVALALVLFQAALAERNSPLFGQYLGGLGRVAERLPELPAIFAGLSAQALRPNRFGLTFVAFVLALAVASRRRCRGCARGLGPLLAWLAFGSAAVVAAFLLSPEPDLQHHLSSSAARLLSHWVGVVWLVVAIVWSRTRRPAAAQPSSN